MTKGIIPLHPPLEPREGRALRVLAVARISTKNQDEKSLDDQNASYRHWLDARYTGKVQWTFIKSQGSGELLDREEIREAEDLIARGKVDLVVTEDLARIFRRSHAYAFCEFCEDHDTRLVAINDSVDTAGDWQVHAWFSTFKGEMHNRDTSKRIKRSMDNRFVGGGTLPSLIYGYEKMTPDAKTDAGLRKVPEAGPVYDMIFTMAEDGASYSEIADWLNDQGVPTGPTCRQSQWSCSMLGRIMHNPILKGVRQRGRRIARRHNQSGRHVSVKAPPEHLKQRHCPHLAFIEPERYDRVIALLDDRNARYRRKGDTGGSFGTPARKRTAWPGQALTCSICGRTMIHQGLAERRWLMCEGASTYRCWNSVCLDARLAGDKLTEAIMQAVVALPDFNEGFRELVQQRAGRARLSITQRKTALADRRNRLEQGLTRLVDFVVKGGDSEQALAQQQQIKAELVQVDAELIQLRKHECRPVELPSIDELRATATDVLRHKVPRDPSYARHLATLAPAIRVQPVRCCTVGSVLLRAEFDLHLVNLFPQLDHVEGVRERLTLPMQVELFDRPQPVHFREQVLDLKKEVQPNGRPLTERQIAKRLGVTQPVVQRAMALHRRMLELGIDDPYQPVSEPPADYGKLRRHRHPRYRFEPLISEPVASVTPTTEDLAA